MLVAGPAVFVIEFKVGERHVNTHDFNQAWDYALDLKNFHLASHAAPILPILVPTESDDGEPRLLDPADDLVFPPMTCNAGALGQALRLGLAHVDRRHARSRSRGPKRRISRPRRSSRRRKRSTRIIPWTVSRATMLGPAISASHPTASKRSSTSPAKPAERPSSLSPACPAQARRWSVSTWRRRSAATAPTHAVFLSGNGPLVKVLREALARDEMTRLRAKNDRTRKGVVQQKIKGVHSERASLPRCRTEPRGSA